MTDEEFVKSIYPKAGFGRLTPRETFSGVPIKIENQRFAIKENDMVPIWDTRVICTGKMEGLWKKAAECIKQEMLSKLEQ